MLQYRDGDLLAQGRDQLWAIGHGCNCKGLMAAGVAKDVRAAYGEAMYGQYRLRCGDGLFYPGMVHLWTYGDPARPYLFNLATQDEPGANAHYGYIALAMHRMCERIDAWSHDPVTIGIPRIGCGLGGLQWEETALTIEAAIRPYPRIQIIVFTLEGV